MYIFVSCMRKILLLVSLCLFNLCAYSQSEAALTSLFLKAVENYTQEEYEEAKEKLVILYNADSSDDAVNYYLGMCEYALGDRDRAEVLLSAAAQLDSTNVWYQSALASVYNAKGDNFAFAAVSEKLIKLSPAQFKTPFVLCSIADAKLSMRQDSLALAYYNEALEMDPSYPPGQLGKVEMLRMQRNYTMFFINLTKFIDNPLVRPELKSDYLKAVLENMDGNLYYGFKNQLEQVIELDIKNHPEDAVAHSLRMNLYYLEDNYEAALEQSLEMAQAAIDSNNKDMLLEAYQIAGDLHHELGNRKECYKYYKKILEINPDYASALNNYAYFLCEEGKSLRKALKMSTRAVELEPDNATYLDTHGWILYLLGRAKEAKPFFKHAMIYGGKDSAVVLEHYSIVLEALGEKELAKYYKLLSEQKQ